jgi:glycosyltransferase involved in cell wall biosynthesis
MTKKVLWWGRFDADYSRNRILRQLFLSLDWEIIDFKPRIGALGDVEAYIRQIPPVDLVWVPCFRQRVLLAAHRWAKRSRIPLIFDPLISAYDKQIWERKKFPKESNQAKKLLKWEQSLFQSADYVVADTEQHSAFFASTMHINSNKIFILPVGAEESLFTSQGYGLSNNPLRILFYGSYIALQGPEIIARAIQLYQGPEVQWHFIGDGPLRKNIQDSLQGLDNVHFTDWVPYADLPQWISNADICLGIFGSTEKTQRVIPNKVYQAMSCARPVITSTSEVYPLFLRQNNESGIFFVPANDPLALAEMVKKLAEHNDLVIQGQKNVIQSYKQYFSNEVIKQHLASLIQSAIL